MKSKYESKIKLFRLIILLTALGLIFALITKLLNEEKNIIDIKSSILGIAGAIIGMILGYILPKAITQKSKKIKIYLSYNINDKTIADKIAEDLTDKGVTILKDSQIKPGENIDDVIKNYINNCDLIYVILSSNTYKSKFLKEEILFAKRKKIPIVPIVTDESELPNFLSNYKIADFRNNYEQALKEIIPN